MKIRLIVPVMAILMTLSSCFVNYHSINGGPEGSRKKGDGTEEYAHGKQHYLFWGLLRIGNGTPQEPAGAYQIKTSLNVWGSLASGLTGGIYGFRKVRFYQKKPGSSENLLPASEPKASVE